MIIYIGFCLFVFLLNMNLYICMKLNTYLHMYVRVITTNVYRSREKYMLGIHSLQKKNHVMF